MKTKLKTNCSIVRMFGMFECGRVVRSIIAVALCAVGLSAFAAEPVKYLDWDDVGKKLTNATCTVYEVVTAEMDIFESGKTYVVMGDVTNETDGITVAGTEANPTRLILCDKAKLVVTGGEEEAGITVAANGATTNALVICGQAKSTGRLTATGGRYAAGIGGGEGSNGGTVTINGGEVTATGGRYAAGIGGGDRSNGGTVTINGGTVTATGGDYAAGIGGGDYCAGGTVTINGGTVTAMGGKYSAGIGGGEDATDHGTVTFGGSIEGRTVLADMSMMTTEEYSDDHTSKFVQIPFEAAVLVPQIAGVSYVASNGTEEVEGMLMDGKTVYLLASGETLNLHFALKPNFDWIKAPDPNPMSIENVSGLTTIDLADLPLAGMPPVEYLDWDDENKQMTNATCTVYEFVTPDTREFAAGTTYVVQGVVTNETDGITVKGTVKNPTRLILCDGAKLVVKCEDDPCPAVSVLGGYSTVRALIICGQAKGTGKLEATGAEGAAGIGGQNGFYFYELGCNPDCGVVTINGGEVTATGGENGAGIGGGCYGFGGMVTINGGVVKATGGENGAGIGGGYYGDGGTVTINGGEVTAMGGGYGAGIGGGRACYGGAVTINGGTVTATGAESSSGIGGGEDGGGGEVTINGGTVIATGEGEGAGIGDSDGDAGTVTINGGEVTAIGGDDGKGIGGWGGSTVTFGDVDFNVVTGATAAVTAPIAQGDYESDHSAKYVHIEQATVKVTLPTTTGYAFAVSNLTEGAEEILPTEAGGTTYALPVGEKVGIYAVPEKGYVVKGEPYIIDEVKSDTKIDASKLPGAKLPEPEISAVSEEGWIDLTVGDRVAKDEETIVVDPAWGEAKTAKVQIEGEPSARTYNCASNDLWQTAALATGRYTLALTAGATNETAVFWKTDSSWVIFDNSNITADVTFEADKTYLMLGTNTANGATLTVTDGAKFAYGEGAGFLGGTVAELPKRYGKKTVGDLYQIYEKIKGSKDNPWEVGVGVEAYTNGTELVIVGEGTIADLSEIPSEVKGGIAAITVGDGVTDAAAGVFFGFDKVAVTLQDNWKGELPDERSTWHGATNVKLTRVPTAVKNVKVQQRYPWNGKVDVDFDLTGEGSAKVTVQVTVDGKKLKSPTVDGETTFDLGKGKELKDLRLTWDAKADFGDAEVHQKIKVKLFVSPAESN